MKDNKKKRLQILRESAYTLIINVVCTGVCFLLDFLKIHDLNFLIIYILGILLIAVLTSGFIYSSVTSILSVAGYNFFFTVPRLTLKINDQMYVVTFILMLLVGIGISMVTFNLKKKMAQVSELNVEKMRLKNDAEKEMIKATLLRSISHDLRTPLTIIKNGAEVLLTCEDISLEERRELLEGIITKSDWTIRLVQNLLSMTKIDSENLTVKKSLEAVEEVLPEAVRNCGDKLGNRKIYYDIPKNLLLVPMDATLIIQAIGNILNNAIRFTKDNGSIWLNVFCTGHKAVFRISNDGESIASSDLEHVFDMYYTTSDCTGNSGVGLGLAICKLIISAHGGEITARNTSDRVVFEFTLPMEEQSGANFNN